MGTTLTPMTLFELAREARARKNPTCWHRADGQVALAPISGPDFSGCKAEISEVHFHPRPQDSAVEHLLQLKQAHPQAQLHGLSPGWVARHGLAALQELEEVGLASFCWFTGELESGSPASQGWEALLDLELPKVGVFVYGPEDHWSRLEPRLARMAQARNLLQVVPLPRAVGDLVVVPGATTDGTRDIEILARCRAFFAPQVRVRASWAALGFKLAQSALAFGCDALAGWGLEEQLAYSGKMRPADVVSRDVVLAGLAEARVQAL